MSIFRSLQAWLRAEDSPGGKHATARHPWLMLGIAPVIVGVLALAVTGFVVVAWPRVHVKPPAPVQHSKPGYGPVGSLSVPSSTTSTSVVASSSPVVQGASSTTTGHLATSATNASHAASSTTQGSAMSPSTARSDETRSSAAPSFSKYLYYYDHWNGTSEPFTVAQCGLLPSSYYSQCVTRWNAWVDEPQPTGISCVQWQSEGHAVLCGTGEPGPSSPASETVSGGTGPANATSGTGTGATAGTGSSSTRQIDGSCTPGTTVSSASMYSICENNGSIECYSTSVPAPLFGSYGEWQCSTQTFSPFHTYTTTASCIGDAVYTCRMTAINEATQLLDDNGCPGPVSGTITPSWDGNRISLTIRIPGLKASPTVGVILDTGGVDTQIPNSIMQEAGYTPSGSTITEWPLVNQTALHEYIYHVPYPEVLDDGTWVPLGYGTATIYGVVNMPFSAGPLLGPNVLKAGTDLSTDGSAWSLTPPCP